MHQHYDLDNFKSKNDAFQQKPGASGIVWAKTTLTFLQLGNTYTDTQARTLRLFTYDSAVWAYDAGLGLSKVLYNKAFFFEK